MVRAHSHSISGQSLASPHARSKTVPGSRTAYSRRLCYSRLASTLLVRHEQKLAMQTPAPAPDDNKSAWVLGCGLYVLGSVVVNFAQVGCRMHDARRRHRARAVLAT